MAICHAFPRRMKIYTQPYRLVFESSSEIERGAEKSSAERDREPEPTPNRNRKREANDFEKVYQPYNRQGQPVITGHNSRIKRRCTRIPLLLQDNKLSSLSWRAGQKSWINEPSDDAARRAHTNSVKSLYIASGTLEYDGHFHVYDNYHH